MCMYIFFIFIHICMKIKRHLWWHGPVRNSGTPPRGRLLFWDALRVNEDYQTPQGVQLPKGLERQHGHRCGLLFFYFKDILGMQQSWIIWFNLLPISVFWHTSNVVFDVVSDVVNLGFVLSHKFCCCKFGGFFLT